MTSPARRPLLLGLPPTWYTVDVDRLSPVMLAARRPVTGASFTPNLAVTAADEPVDVPIVALADRALGRLAGGASRVTLIADRRWGGGIELIVARTIRVVTRRGAAPARAVIQCQVHYGGPSRHLDVVSGGDVVPVGRGGAWPAPATHEVVRLVLSCAPAQEAIVGAEFEAIINSLRLPIGEPRADEGVA